jgi:NAD(P)-dependent dehydrogenase (short-subunit alcohol dehydrogenase family)
MVGLDGHSYQQNEHLTPKEQAMASQAVDSKVSLITGANKGIGLEIARQLSRQGMTVLIGARNADRGGEAAKGQRSEGTSAHFIRLNVTSQNTIDQAARRIEDEFGRLDILVNNAGICIDDAPPSRLDMAVLRRTYETNVFGLVAVTRAMLPLLRKSSAGRIVNMSSGLGSLTLTNNPNWTFASINLLAYNSSKTAVNAITVQFAKELHNTPIKVNAADPGYTATDLNHHTGTRSVEQGAWAAVRLATLSANGPSGGFFDEDGTQPW